MRTALAAAFTMTLLTLCGCLTNSGRSSPGLLADPARDAITFWGHACFHIDTGGVRIVTDPVFEDSYSPVSERKSGVPSGSAISQIDIVLISHAHTDHLSPRTLGQFPATTTILCPGASVEHLSGMKANIRSMKPGEEVTVGGIVVTAVPALHAGGRRSIRAAADGRALGFLIRTGDRTIYYSGDTKYSAELGGVLGEQRPDIVLLNVNMHLHSAEALKLVRASGASVVVPGHHGAFDSPYAPKAEVWRRELKGALEQGWRELSVGGSLLLPAAAAGGA